MRELESQRRAIDEQRQRLEQERQELEVLRRELQQQQQHPVQTPTPPTPTTQPSMSRSTPSERNNFRLPDFTPHDPECFFVVFEATLRSAGITDNEAKYTQLLGALGPRYITEVRDVVLRPLSNDSYEVLKSELIKRLSETQEQKTKKLLEHEAIGDRKPSQFLRHLRSLAGNIIGDAVLRTIWLSRLPAHIQPHLLTKTDSTLEQLADVADIIAEATQPYRPTVAETTRPYRPTVAETTNDTALEIRLAELQLAMRRQMDARFETLYQRIDSIATQQDGRRPRSRSPSWQQRPGARGRSRSRSRDRPTSGTCWYHWRFGAEAKKCTPPCTYTNSNQTGNDQAGR